MSFIFYMIALLCLIIVATAIKKPENLDKIEKLKDMGRFKVITVFSLLCFLSFLFGRGCSGDDKKVVTDDKKDSKIENKQETKNTTIETTKTITDPVALFKKAIDDKDYFIAYNALSRLSPEQKKSLLSADINLTNDEYNKMQIAFKEKYKEDLEKINTEFKKNKNNQEALSLSKKLLETEPKFEDPANTINEILKTIYKDDITKINDMIKKNSYKEAEPLINDILKKEPRFKEVSVLKQKVEEMLSYFNMSKYDLKDKIVIKSCACYSYIKNDLQSQGGETRGERKLNEALASLGELAENKLRCKITIYNPTPIKLVPETDVDIQFLSSTDAKISSLTLSVKENINPFKSVDWTESDIVDPRDKEEMRRTAKTVCTIDSVSIDH